MRMLSPRTRQLASRWVPSLATYGAATGLSILFFTDWKLVMQYVPYIGGKFKD